MLCRFPKVIILTVIVAASGPLLSGQSSAASDMDEGVQAVVAGQWDRAVRFWTKAIEKNPKSYVAHVNRGSAYMRSGHVLKAISDWHKARELAPVFAYAVYTEDFIIQNSSDNSILNYVVPLELEPDHIPSVIMAGSTYQDLGKTEKAATLYRQSIDLTKNPLLKAFFDHWVNTIEASPHK
jgi:tetratricopeptide (TPR) repeat protein